MTSYFHTRKRSTVVLTGLLLCLLSINAVPGYAQATFQQKEANDVERLKQILRRYYAEEDTLVSTATAASAARIEIDASTGESKAPEHAYLSSTVFLSPTQAVLALEDMSQRLESNAVTSLRREMDVIFHVEIRNQGKLVSSQSYSLKALGKSQYVTKVALAGGDAVITLRNDEWTTVIAADEVKDYLIILNTPHDQPPELHILSVDDLRSANLAELPPWLPYIGATPNQS